MSEARSAPGVCGSLGLGVCGAFGPRCLWLKARAGPGCAGCVLQPQAIDLFHRKILPRPTLCAQCVLSAKSTRSPRQRFPQCTGCTPPTPPRHTPCLHPCAARHRRFHQDGTSPSVLAAFT
eukprot:363388-Chlamydomonas_euryale.AAC.1